jgi:hypothetical protein
MELIARIHDPMYRSVRAWTVGVDIGQSSDPTAVAAVESISWLMTPEFERRYPREAGYPRTQSAQDVIDACPRTEHHVRALQRLPLGTSYPDQCTALAGMLATPALRDAQVFLDAGGVGTPVSDLFMRAGIRHTPIWITGGRDEAEHRGGLSVPKLHLISRLQAALHAGELKIAKTLPEASAFVRELQEFRCTWTEAGHLQFGARQGAHDDLVLAASYAIYGATRPRPAMTLNMGFAT